MLSDDNKVIAEKFNHYFANIGSDLATKIPNVSTDFKQFLSGNYAQSLFLRPVHDEKNRNIINSLKEGAPGADSITANVLKCVLNYIVNPLTHICQLSLSQGYFPSDLKIAKIVPLCKCKDPCLFNKYRPISLLSIFSKVLEKVMYDKLYEYLLKFEVLYSYQFGFQKNKSTYMAIICLMDKLVQALEKRGGRNWKIHWFSESIWYSGPYYSTGKIALLRYQRQSTQLAFQLFNGKPAVCWIQPNYFKPT